ncbi:S-layer protein [Nanoarchaeota archaeon]
MVFVVDKREGETYSLPAKEVDFGKVKCITSKLAEKIIKLIAQRPMYATELAKELKVHEQKIYYHIRNLEKNGMIKVIKRETKKGAVASYYTLVEPAVVVRFKEFEKTQKIFQLKEKHKRFLEPFIKDGVLDALIIVGSPDPHGPDKARSRDGYYGMDLALFLGTFLNYVPKLNVKLDTETRSDDLQNNIILIGGPIVNTVTDKFNRKLPVKFEGGVVKSTVSGREYVSDEIGIVVKAKNPFAKGKNVLLVAGKRFSGTRAAITAFLKRFDEVCQGNNHNPKIMAKVVEGVDLDSDGIVDDVEIRE